MGIIDYRTYQQEMEKEASRESSSNSNQNRSSIGYFSLKNDKDTSIVRILIDSMDDVQIINLHRVPVGGRMRAVSCLRNPHDPIANCPFCSADKKLESKIYVPLIEYVKEDDGQVHAYPKIWEKSARYSVRLANLINDYGPLSECLFKITRNGAPGDRATTYSENYCRPDIFPEAIYKKDTSAFNGFSALGRMVLDLTNTEAMDVLNGEVPERLAPKSNNNAQPAVSKDDYIAASADRAFGANTAPAYAMPQEAPAPTAPRTAPAAYARPSEETVRPRRYYN